MVRERAPSGRVEGRDELYGEDNVVCWGGDGDGVWDLAGWVWSCMVGGTKVVFVGGAVNRFSLGGWFIGGDCLGRGV